MLDLFAGSGAAGASRPSAAARRAPSSSSAIGGRSASSSANLERTGLAARARVVRARRRRRSSPAAAAARRRGTLRHRPRRPAVRADRPTWPRASSTSAAPGPAGSTRRPSSSPSTSGRTPPPERVGRPRAACAARRFGETALSVYRRTPIPPPEGADAPGRLSGVLRPHHARPSRRHRARLRALRPARRGGPHEHPQVAQSSPAEERARIIREAIDEELPGRRRRAASR